MNTIDAKTFVVGNPLPQLGGDAFGFAKLVIEGVDGTGEVDGAIFTPHVAPP